MPLDATQRARIGTLRPLMQAIRDADRRGPAFLQAAAASGLSEKRIQALFYAWQKTGDLALQERRLLKRPRTSTTPKLSAGDRRHLRQYALKCDSVQLAIEHFAASPDCSPELRAWITPFIATRQFPKALYRAARVTPEDRDQARGAKGFHARAFTQFRDNTWIDSAGTIHPLIGGDLWECDDMSTNQPYFYEWPYGGDPLSDKWGVRLGRQVLICVDVATGKYLGYDLIGRVRDAYRAEDVIRFLGRILNAHGIPHLGFRLEKGAWAARSIRGIKGTSDDTERETIHSVSDAVNLHYVFESKSKGVVEGSFDHLQSILALIGGPQIGRRRGEYEKSTQAMQRCTNAKDPRHPAEFGFLHISEIADKLDEAMALADGRVKLGPNIQGIPNESFAAGLTQNPLLPLSAEKQHLFLPTKIIRPIDAGHVRIKVPHYAHTFSFRVPAQLANLGRGYRLLCCFDPADPHAGAHIFDAETDRKRDYEATTGQPYGIIPFAPDAPQIDLSKRHRQTDKKDYLAAARTLFRATGMQTGTGASIDQVADGKGNSTTIRRGFQPQNDTRPATEKPRVKAAFIARQNHVTRGTIDAEDRARAKRLLTAVPA